MGYVNQRKVDVLNFPEAISNGIMDMMNTTLNYRLSTLVQMTETKTKNNLIQQYKKFF